MARTTNIYSARSVSEADGLPTNDAIVSGAASVLCNASAWTEDRVPAVTAGPLMTCAEGACSGPPTGGPGSEHCRAGFNSPSVELRAGRAGTHWAPALSTPAWAQFVFPATPVNTARLTMRYTLVLLKTFAVSAITLFWIVIMLHVLELVIMLCNIDHRW